MGEKHVVYSEAFEQLLKYGVGKNMSPTLKAKLKDAGFDLEKIQPSYPKQLWEPVLDVVRTNLFPGVPREEALFKMGASMVTGAAQTVMGKAMLGMAKLIGPEKTLLRTQQQYRAGTNFTDVKMEKKGERHYEMWVNEGARIPDFTRGTLAGTLEYTGGKNVRVAVVKTEGESVTFDIRWS